jgi:hypothetical protein
MVVLDPFELTVLMRFNATMSLNGLSTKAYTLIDTIASLNFVSKKLVMANGSLKIVRILLS